MPVSPEDRERALREFALAELKPDTSDWTWQPVAGDASSRRYFRLAAGGLSWVCADSPPATEKNDAFVHVHARLSAAGLPVPELLALDSGRGFLLVEDFGDRHLLQVLDTGRPSPSYEGALPLLFCLQAADAAGLPDYAADLLREEFSRFYEWFCLGWLNLSPRSERHDIVNTLGEALITAALEQPQVFVFRDFHCRNVLVRPDGRLGLIDFQDAVRGPLCYDLVSLLRDCYVRWPEPQVREWALGYRQRLRDAGRPAGVDDRQFLRWFDWIGLHRHLKVLGNFTRLALRDGKRGYLADIPLVLDYVESVLESYPEFADFRHWFDSELRPLIARQNWSGQA